MLWLAMIGYALQVYGDFSGYTDMAIGSAHLLGYKLAQNFNMPYLAKNIAEFWRRWHISLSTWLRDYVFIPLGGSRGGHWITSRNLILTMTLAGLWHGANWNFVLFGFIQGLLLTGHRFFRLWAEEWPGLQGVLGSAWGTAARTAFTFVVFCLTLVIFRSTSLASAWTYYEGLFFSNTRLGLPPINPLSLLLTLLVVAVCHLVAVRGWHRAGFGRTPAPLVGASYAVVLTFILLVAPANGKAFIYFQF
jgi:alginate O-acetyltransferase complex protein AlgI